MNEYRPALDVYSNPDGAADLDRLRLLADWFRPTTRALFDRVGIRPGMACLDVGCGAADTTFELARRVGDRGRVIGIDIDEAILDRVRADAPGNVELRVGDIRTIEPAAVFDLVNARFVLDHLARPRDALAVMRGMLRSGGRVCAECGDYSGWYCYPRSASFDRIVELVTEQRARTGGSADAGAMLPVLLVDAGFTDVHTNIFQHVQLDGPYKRWVLSAITEERAAWMTALDLTDEGEIRRLREDMMDLIEDSKVVMGTPRMVQCWGRAVARPHSTGVEGCPGRRPERGRA